MSWCGVIWCDLIPFDSGSPSSASSRTWTVCPWLDRIHISPLSSFFKLTQDPNSQQKNTPYNNAFGLFWFLPVKRLNKNKMYATRCFSQFWTINSKVSRLRQLLFFPWSKNHFEFIHIPWEHLGTFSSCLHTPFTYIQTIIQMNSRKNWNQMNYYHTYDWQMSVMIALKSSFLFI